MAKSLSVEFQEHAMQYESSIIRLLEVRVHARVMSRRINNAWHKANQTV